MLNPQYHEVIEDQIDYVRSKFMGMPAIIKKSNKWVNASNFTFNVGSRNYAKWKTSKHSESIIKAFKSQEVLMTRGCDLVASQEHTDIYEEEVVHNNQEVCGTYVHPSIMATFVMWCSPKNAIVMTNTLVNYDEILQQQYKANRILAHRSQELSTNINGHCVHDNNILRAIHHARKQMDKTHSQVQEMQRQMDETKKQMDESIRNLNIEFDLATDSILTWRINVSMLRNNGFMVDQYGWYSNRSLNATGDSFDSDEGL